MSMAIEHELANTFVAICNERGVQANVAIRALVLCLAGLMHKYLHDHLDAALAEVEHDVRAIYASLDKPKQ